jgi:large subunit ribosomal protein L28
MISYLPMGMKCNNCGKGVMYGHNVSHSKRRTARVFKPNLHVLRVAVNGRSIKTRLCTKCLRMVKRSITPVEAVETVVEETPQAPATV